MGPGTAAEKSRTSKSQPKRKGRDRQNREAARNSIKLTAQGEQAQSCYVIETESHLARSHAQRQMF